jgi:signal recognition particle subunit SRP54
MTRQERQGEKTLDASRKTRIAKGSGSTIAEVNQLLRQYEQMKKMMAQMNRGGLLGGLGKKMMGGLAGGLGGMLGGGMNGGLAGMLGGGSDYGTEPNGSTKIKKKKRHKKRK